MKFHSYDKDKKTFSVTILRIEAEDLRRIMQGIAEHIDELDGTAMGIYTKEEAMTHAEYMDGILRSASSSTMTLRADMPHLQLLHFVDAFSEIYSTESDENCQKLGLDKKAITDYYFEMSNANRMLVKGLPPLDKKKLSNPAPV